MQSDQATSPVSEDDIRRSALYQNMRIKASQAFLQLNQRLDSLEGNLGQRLQAMENGSRERLRLVESGQATLQQSFDLLKTWRTQFNKRLAAIETLVGGLAGRQVEPARGRVVPRYAPEPLLRTVMGALAVVLLLGSGLFAASLVQEHRQAAAPAQVVAADVPPSAAAMPVPITSAPPIAVVPDQEPLGLPTPALQPPHIIDPHLQVVPQAPLSRRTRRRMLAIKVPRPRLRAWAPHRVRPGETWLTVARRHRLSPAQLMDLNRSVQGRSLRRGDVIRVPGPALLTNPQNLTLLNYPAARFSALRVHMARPSRRIYSLLHRRDPLLRSTGEELADRPSLPFDK